ncbi:MAG: copper amine oxidase N-terminal domain-containing protein [Anaerotignaceae bacterium]
MKLKVFFSTLAISALMVSTVFASINLTIDNKPLDMEVPPAIVEGRTLVPLRAIFENLGATVEWEEATKTVTAKRADTTIQLVLESDRALVNHVEKDLDAPAKSVDGRIMVPVRFVAESLNCNVEWSGETETVVITTKQIEEAVKITEEVATVNEITTEIKEVPKSSATTIEQLPPVEETIATKEVATTNSGGNVYITKTGKKYHYSNSCNGGTYFKSTLKQALAKNLGPCSKCVN